MATEATTQISCPWCEHNFAALILYRFVHYTCPECGQQYRLDHEDRTQTVKVREHKPTNGD